MCHINSHELLGQFAGQRLSSTLNSIQTSIQHSLGLRYVTSAYDTFICPTVSTYVQVLTGSAGWQLL